MQFRLSTGDEGLGIFLGEDGIDGTMPIGVRLLGVEEGSVGSPTLSGTGEVGGGPKLGYGFEAVNAFAQSPSLERDGFPLVCFGGNSLPPGLACGARRIDRRLGEQGEVLCKDGF